MKTIQEALLEAKQEIEQIESKPNKTLDDYDRISLLKAQIQYVEDYVLWLDNVMFVAIGMMMAMI